MRAVRIAGRRPGGKLRRRVLVSPSLPELRSVAVRGWRRQIKVEPFAALQALLGALCGLVQAAGEADGVLSSAVGQLASGSLAVRGHHVQVVASTRSSWLQAGMAKAALRPLRRFVV